MRVFARPALLALAILSAPAIANAEDPPRPQTPSDPALIADAIGSIGSSVQDGTFDAGRLHGAGWESQTALGNDGQPVHPDWKIFTRGSILLMVGPDGHNSVALARIASTGDYAEVVSDVTRSLGQPTGRAEDGSPVWLSASGFVLQVSQRAGEQGPQVIARFLFNR